MCNEFDGKQDDYVFVLEAVEKKIKAELDFYYGFGSQHIGVISSLVLCVYSSCMCGQILTDSVFMFSVLLRFTLSQIVL